MTLALSLLTFNKPRLFCIALVFVVLSACGHAVPKLNALDRDAVVLAFGDSLTFGTGAAMQDSYPAVLEKLINRKVVTAAVPGEISKDGLVRLPEVLDEVQPKLLILCHGGNDFLRKLDDGQAISNIRAMIQLARDRNVAVVMIATPKPGLTVTPPDFYRDLAKEFDLPLEDEILKEVLSDRALKSDFVHPNAQGYKRMAEAVAMLLQKAGAI